MTDEALLTTLEARAGSGEAFAASDVEALLKSADLLAMGRLGEAARRRITGDTVTFCRVLQIGGSDVPASAAAAGEVRIARGAGGSDPVDAMAEQVSAVRPLANTLPLTGFSVADLLSAGADSTGALSVAAKQLRAAGLEALAECPVDAFESTDAAIRILGALAESGLPVWRLTVDEAPGDRRLPLIERAAAIQKALGTIRAFAPLPRRDPAHEPSTGYDDVRTVAAARLMCPGIRLIQVDWPLYGPKLAQVAVLYGANDIDGVAAVDDPAIGARRAPAEEIRRQIRAAACVPVERDGRYETIGG